jgi:hypothetical protein
MGKTTVAVDGDAWLINGEPTYPGRTYRGWKVEGLLLNSRMVQATFDDENPVTRPLWAYPDTGVWDAERNTDECVAAMPSWVAHGLTGITVCLQGGRPMGYGGQQRDVMLQKFGARGLTASEAEIWKDAPFAATQPWINTAFTPQGELKPAYLARLGRVLDAADANGLVVIVSLFYQGQDERMQDEAAIRRGVENVCAWVLDRGDTNVVIEINNECNTSHYEQEVLKPGRVQELIAQARGVTRNGRRLLCGTSYAGMRAPDDEVCAVSDLLTMHGNGAREPGMLAELIAQARSLPSYRPMPVLFNEDFHFSFDQPRNNFLTAVEHYAGWGYYDPGRTTDGHEVTDRYAFGDYVDGFQMVPVNWTINTERKRAFFGLLKDVTGA